MRMFCEQCGNETKKGQGLAEERLKWTGVGHNNVNLFSPPWRGLYYNDQDWVRVIIIKSEEREYTKEKKRSGKKCREWKKLKPRKK